MAESKVWERIHTQEHNVGHERREVQIKTYWMMADDWKGCMFSMEWGYGCKKGGEEIIGRGGT